MDRSDQARPCHLPFEPATIRTAADDEQAGTGNGATHPRQRADEDVLALAPHQPGDAHDDRTIPVELCAQALTLSAVARMEQPGIDTRGQVHHARGDRRPEGRTQPPTHVLTQIGHYIKMSADPAE